MTTTRATTKPRTAQVSSPTAALPAAAAILAQAQSGREVIQDFCPLADSLEWELGQEYLRARQQGLHLRRHAGPLRPLRAFRPPLPSRRRAAGAQLGPARRDLLVPDLFAARPQIRHRHG